MHALKTAAEKALLFLADIIVRAAFLAYRTAAFIVALGKAGVILALAVAVLASAPVAIAWLLSRIPGFEGLAPPAWLLPLAPLTLLTSIARAWSRTR